MKRNRSGRLTLNGIFSNCSQQSTLSGVGCKFWRLSHTSRGYPVVHNPQSYRDNPSGNRMMTVRRVVWGLKFGPMPVGKKHVVMKCKNRSCVAWSCMVAMNHSESQKFMRAPPSVLAQVSRIVNLPTAPRRPLPQSSVFNMAA